MDSTDFFASHLTESPLVGIFRGLDLDRTLELCSRAWDNGIHLIEIPIQSREAVDCLRAAVKAGAAIGRLVGAGTVTSPERAQAAADAGAAFTVAPGIVPAVVAESERLGLPHLPGVATSSEIGLALGLGLRWQKMFPAAQLGASWLAAQHGPYPEVCFVATGGIDSYNAEEFLRSGASAVAVGNAFADHEQIERLAQLRS